jgi:hypothetical protein
LSALRHIYRSYRSACTPNTRTLVAELEEKHKKELHQQEQQIEQKLKKQLEEKTQLEFSDLKKQLQEKEAKVQELRQEELSLREQKRKLEEREKDMALENISNLRY